MMDTNYYNKKVSDFFHIYSDGTRMDVLFETDEDCVFGMNLLAVSAFQCHLEIICPEIMKTHFHLIIKGEAQQVRKYAGEIKRRLTGYFHRDGRRHIVKDAIQIVSDPICSEEELRTKMIYVLSGTMPIVSHPHQTSGLLGIRRSRHAASQQLYRP